MEPAPAARAHPRGKRAPLKMPSATDSSPSVVVPETESDPGFQSILAQHMLRLAPANDVEQGYIDEMVASCWRLRRAWAIETRFFDNGVQDQPSGDDLGRLAAALARRRPGIGAIA